MPAYGISLCALTFLSHYQPPSQYPTVFELIFGTVHRIFIDKEPFQGVEWSALISITISGSLLMFCAWESGLLGMLWRTIRACYQKVRAWNQRIGGVWGAVDNLCGYVFGYDPQEWEEWVEWVEDGGEREEVML